MQWNSQEQELREGSLRATEQLCLDKEGDWAAVQQFTVLAGLRGRNEPLNKM